jgi:hypothetical protein
MSASRQTSAPAARAPPQTDERSEYTAEQRSEWRDAPHDRPVEPDHPALQTLRHVRLAQADGRRVVDDVGEAHRHPPRREEQERELGRRDCEHHERRSEDRAGGEDRRAYSEPDHHPGGGERSQQASDLANREHEPGDTSSRMAKTRSTAQAMLKPMLMSAVVASSARM